MCGPVAGAIIGIAGGVVSGIGGMMQARAQAAGYRAQAALQERQALMERDAGVVAAQRKQDELRRLIGKQIAGYSANGLAIEGSALSTIMDTASEGAKDVAAIRYGAVARSGNEAFGAKVSRMNASIASRSAPIAFLSPILQSATRFGGSFA